MSPHIGHLPEVILLKLFLDVVQSSSKDVTRAKRGPKRLSYNYTRRHGGKCSEKSAFFSGFQKMFLAQKFSALPAVFLFSWDFVCLLLV